MTQKHDYKAALESMYVNDYGDWCIDSREGAEAIRHALKLAHKLEQGESSSKMDTIAEMVFEDRVGNEHDIQFYDHAEAIFKAMIEQAKKEIE